MPTFATNFGDEFLTAERPVRQEPSRLTTFRQLKDADPMPMGAHRGERMQDVPADYLLAIGEKPWISQYPALADYIERNRKYLDDEVERSERDR
jgi:hypothetical protein